MRRTLLLSAALLLALTSPARVAGQDPDPSPAPPARDPFQATGVAQAAPQELPEVTLGGLVLMRGRPALALLRLGEQGYVVRVGTVLHVDGQGRRAGAQTRRIELRVAAIDREGVTLRVGDAGVELVLR